MSDENWLSPPASNGLSVEYGPVRATASLPADSPLVDVTAALACAVFGYAATGRLAGAALSGAAGFTAVQIARAQQHKRRLREADQAALNELTEAWARLQLHQALGPST